MGVDFETAKAILADDVEGLCKRYLPNGKKSGGWWLASCPWRTDKHPSLVVNLQSGRWKDMARPADRGDVIDLIARITGESTRDIMRRTCGGT